MPMKNSAELADALAKYLPKDIPFILLMAEPGPDKSKFFVHTISSKIDPEALIELLEAAIEKQRGLL